MCRIPFWFKDGRKDEGKYRSWGVARTMTATTKLVSFDELATTL